MYTEEDAKNDGRADYLYYQQMEARDKVKTDPFTDYQRIVHRTSDLIATMRARFDRDSSIGIALEHLEREYAMIIADETYISEVGE